MSDSGLQGIATGRQDAHKLVASLEHDELRTGSWLFEEPGADASDGGTGDETSSKPSNVRFSAAVLIKPVVAALQQLSFGQRFQSSTNPKNGLSSSEAQPMRCIRTHVCIGKYV